MERRSAYDYAGAIAILDRLVALAPDWAEAWNQRATMRFLADDLDGSLADCERVLELEPKHFGALSGQALILMRQGRFDTAQSILRKAVEIDPFLAERALLVEPQKRGRQGYLKRLAPPPRRRTHRDDQWQRTGVAFSAGLSR